MNTVIENLVYSLGSCGVVGFLFWSFLSARFSNYETIIDELRRRIVELEGDRKRYLEREDYRNEKNDFAGDITKLEDRLEKKIDEMNRRLEGVQRSVNETPAAIANMIKSIIPKKD